MPLPHKLPQLLAAAVLVAGLVFCIDSPVEAKGKKGKTSAQSNNKSRTQARSARGRSSRRGKARRAKRNRRAGPVYNAYAAPPTYPDRIEVIEYGTDSPSLAQWLNMPKPSNLFNLNFTPPDSSAPIKHRNVQMDQSRVVEIQQALASRGFYLGEMTGEYDNATVEAMRRFQVSEKIPITGYPTAHSLKRLGLAR